MYYPWFPFGGTEALRGPGRKWKNQESPVVSPPLHSPSQRLWFWIALAEASLRSLPPPTPGVRWALPHCHPQLPGHQRLGKSSVLFSGSCGAGSQPLQKEFCLFFSFPFFYEVRLISAPNINLLCHFRGRWRMSTEMDFHACLSLVSPVFFLAPLWEGMEAVEEPVSQVGLTLVGPRLALLPSSHLQVLVFFTCVMSCVPSAWMTTCIS